jgi:hypothetical protein
MYIKEHEWKNLSGIHCVQCGKWIKWATEDEKRTLPDEAGARKAMNAHHPLVIENKYKEIEKIVNSPDYYTLGTLDKIAEVVKG